MENQDSLVPFPLASEGSERPLSDLFHRVNSLLPENQTPYTISPDTKALKALTLMKRRGFSQLPVVQGDEVLGVFSYRSFAEGVVRMAQEHQRPESLPVEDFLERLTFVHVTDEIQSIFHELDVKDAVLVGQPNRLLAIATTYDALRYLYGVAGPFFLLQEVELALRALVMLCVSGSELVACIEKSLRHNYVGREEKLPKRVEDLSLGEYMDVICDRDNWPKFQGPFGSSRERLKGRLRPLNTIRNGFLHFRSGLTAEDYEILASARDWLLMKLRSADVNMREKQDD